MPLLMNDNIRSSTACSTLYGDFDRHDGGKVSVSLSRQIAPFAATRHRAGEGRGHGRGTARGGPRRSGYRGTHWRDHARGAAGRSIWRGERGAGLRERGGGGPAAGQVSTASSVNCDESHQSTPASCSCGGAICRGRIGAPCLLGRARHCSARLFPSPAAEPPPRAPVSSSHVGSPARRLVDSSPPPVCGAGGATEELHLQSSRLSAPANPA